MKMKHVDVVAASQLFVGIWNSVLAADKERTEKKEKPPQDLRMRYAITRNQKILADPLEAVKKVGFEAYETRRIELIKSHAVKGEDGQPVVSEKGEMTLEGVEALNKELTDLQNENKVLFDFLEEECEIQPFLMKLDDIVLNIPLGPQDLTILMPFIKE